MKLPVIKTILLTAITWQSPLANAQILISEVGAAPPRKEAKSEPKRKAAKKKAPKKTSKITEKPENDAGGDGVSDS